MNTGEGGLSRYHEEGWAAIVFQMGTGKFGVRNSQGGLSVEKLAKIASKEAVRMFEIKLSQGAKPGRGAYCPAKR